MNSPFRTRVDFLAARNGNASAENVAFQYVDWFESSFKSSRALP